MEIWKTIEDFTNYEVSSYGNVRRKKCEIIYSNGVVNYYKEKLLNQELCRLKYKRVTFSQNNIQKRYLVHRLVAFYFIPNYENKPCVNHIDGNGLNNNILNLEWCSYSENEKHSYNVLKKNNPARKLSKNDVLYIFKVGVKGLKGNVTELKLKYNVSRNLILNIIKKKTYKEWILN